MKQFSRRRIIIKTMEKGDVEDYYMQLPMDEKERKRKVEATKQLVKQQENSTPDSMLIFAIKEVGSNRMIGTILTKNIGTGKVSLQISIPKETNQWMYGVEIIDQFIKICREDKFFTNIKFIKLDENCNAAKKYIEGMENPSFYIKVS